MQKIIEEIKQTWNINEVCELVADACGCEVYFDASRAWALYTDEKPAAEKTPGQARKYGAYRDYLGGGVRGAIGCNLTDALRDLFVAGLQQIEEIINADAEPDACEWELPTGVLING